MINIIQLCVFLFDVDITKCALCCMSKKQQIKVYVSATINHVASLWNQVGH